MNRLLALPLFWLLAATALAQDSLRTPRLVLDFPLADCPYHTYAARTAASPLIACATCKANAKHNVQAFGNPSMRQSVAYSQNVYSALHYAIKWPTEKLFKRKTETSRFVNRVVQGTAGLVVDYMLYGKPLGAGWTHEETHRAAMTVNYIGSQNDVWYPSRSEGQSVIAVSHLSDTNLVLFKANNVPGIVRMNEAGIEGEYQLVKNLQENNFFYGLHLANFGVSFLSVSNSISYVRLCTDPKMADSLTLDMNQKDGTDVMARDFTGLDFLGWIYDLSRPGEPYPARGVHPSGVGIDRYILTTDLTTEEMDYLKKMGDLQRFNLANPMLWGINRIPVWKDKTGGQWYANAALRHTLTSFGYDLQTDVLLQTPKFGAALSLHQYHNLNSAFAGLEARVVNYPLTVKGKPLPVSARLMAWSQPEDHAFRTSNGQFGGLLGFNAAYPLNRWLHPYLEAEAKTYGWVMGNPFLSPNLTVRMGVRMAI